jgi:DNA-binding response OmpR family regulator
VRVLLVEDDDRVAGAQQDVLRRHGFTVVRVSTAADALARLDASVDVVLLDLGLPDGDGFEVCARIRRTSDVPVLVTTARADLRSRVHGLHLGADDYLVKPYDVRELMARIHAVTRRAAGPAGHAGSAGAEGTAGPDASGPLEVAGLQVDLRRREVTAGGRVVPLTRKEFDVLALLAGRAGVVFRRDQILAEVWGAGGSTHTLDVHVASLRAKTGVPGLVETVRGVGYRLGALDPVDPLDPVDIVDALDALDAEP